MVRIDRLSLIRLARDILAAAGADDRDAGVVADALVWADERARYHQGTVWLEALTQRLADGTIRSPATMTSAEPFPTTLALEAGGAFGHVAMESALSFVREKAATLGVAIATVTNSSHFGACGYYADRLASVGFLAFVASNAYPKVAAYGGRSAVLGTNPLAFGAPSSDVHTLIGDLSTGALAGSTVREKLESGQPLPPDAALDRHGRSTRDPQDLLNGGVMLPFGGAKGFALGIMVEVLTSALGDGAPPDRLGSMFRSGPPGTSHIVLAISAPEGMGDRVDHLRRLILASEPQEGMTVRLPGERVANRGAGDTAGGIIELPQATTKSLQTTMRAVGVTATFLS